MWISIIAPLSELHRCYCVDTITDANKSVATKGVREVADYVAWLRETFAALGIENARVGCPTAAGLPRCWACTRRNWSIDSF
jgi:hypothetical protein